jgi:hypothetical protein
MLVCSALVAAPYVTWLSWQTGQFRLETKSLLNAATQLRIQQGLPPYGASFAVNPDLVAEGIWMQPNIDVIKSYRFGVGDYAAILIGKSRDLLRDTASTIASSLEFGSPMLFALAVLGMFGRPWPPRLAIDQLHLLALLALTALAPFFIYYWSLRFYLLFLILFCIWAVAGLSYLVQWARLTVAECGHPGRMQEWAGRAIAVLALAALLVPAVLFATMTVRWTLRSRPVVALSTELAAGSTALKIADTSTPFAFHARAEFVWLPYGDEATALRYLAKKHVTHVVLSSDALDRAPYLKSWAQHGVPGGQLVGQVRTDGGRHVQVFRVRPAP